MSSSILRKTVDLSGFPDLVVIYLGMRVNRWTGLKTVFGFGPKIAQSVEAQPDGLLLHEPLRWSMLPSHVGMRQHWRDFDALESWARSDPHRRWWQQFFRETGGTGFWYETYFMRGGMEAVYNDILQEIGFLRFAPAREAKGPLFTARNRAGRTGDSALPPAVTEEELDR